MKANNNVIFTLLLNSVELSGYEILTLISSQHASFNHNAKLNEHDTDGYVKNCFRLAYLQMIIVNSRVVKFS